MMKKIYYFIIGFVILGILATTAIAASRSDIIRAGLSSSKQELEGGQEVLLTLRFDEYKTKEGINCFKAKLDYDKQTFEKVVQTNFKTQNNWEELKYNQDTGEFVVIKKAGSKSEEDIAQITLKVKPKEEINAGKTEIKIAEIITSEGEEDLLIEDAKIQLDIIKEQESGDIALGDINADGQINARDAKMALQYFTGKIQLTEEQIKRADVNKDGQINARDAKLILQYFTGKIESF